MPAPDAAPPPPLLGARGAACSPKAACAEGLACGPLPGGYCLSPCGLTGGACDGACVETGRAGELCLKSCTHAGDCRAAEGYVCDPQWHACLLPNVAAIVPKQCPAAGPARDAAFGDAAPWSTKAAPGVYQFEPSAVVTDDGGVAALYITRSSQFEGNALGESRVDGKGASTIDVPVKSAKQSHFDPWLARDRKGTLYAVWYGFDGRDQAGEIALVTSKDRGETWSAPAAVHDPADCQGDGDGCLDKPMVVVGPDPKKPAADIVYVMYSGNDAGLRVRASRDGGATFGATTTALEGIYGNAVAGSDGRVHVVTLAGGPMGAFGSAQQTVQYAVTADAGATWTKPLVVSGREEMLPFFFSNPSIAIDDRRKWTYFAYVRGGRDAVWDIVIAATRDAGKTWTRQTIGDGCAIHMVPNLALDPTTGTLHVTWYDSDGAPGRFAHATCTVGAAKCTPLGAINSVPFAALSTVRHGARWIGEYESLLVDDKRRMLHAVWTEPVDEGGKIVARIFHAKAKLR